MPRYSDQLKLEAENAFVRRGWTLEEISERMSIGRAAVRNWSGKLNWVKKRAEYRQESPTVPLETLKDQRRLLIESMGAVSVADPAQVNQLAQLNKVIESMESRVDAIGPTLDVLERFALWARSHCEPPVVVTLAGATEQYLNHMRQEAHG